MKEVKVSRAKLLVVLIENKRQHIADYLEAVEEYKVAALEAIAKGVAKLNAQIETVKAMTPKTVEHIRWASVTLSIPVSHESEYNRAIRMVEMSVDEEIVLSEKEFTKYVLDEWDWKSDFENTKMSYLNK